MNGRTFLLSVAAILAAGAATVTAGTFTFSNTNAIIINDSASPPTAASPYPSTNQVAGLEGSLITKVTVSLYGFAHTFPSDVAIVLVGPEGQNAILIANVGGSTKMPVSNVDLTLDDDAAFYVPLNSALISGTFKPTTNTFSFPFSAPAPTTDELMGPFLSNFQNTEPNGPWKLFVVDDYQDDSGVIAGGWSLIVSTMPVLLSIAQQQTNAVLSWTNAATGYTLQSSPALTPPAWTNVDTAPVIVGGYYTVTNPITTNRMFYRLTK